MEKVMTFLFQLSGAIVFWAEIISTALGLVVAIYTSVKIGKLFKLGDNNVNLLPTHSSSKR